jgi:DnaJ-class molecular chaperone
VDRVSVAFKDYYKILGVDKKASDKEIKSAYRKLARKYHPDVNPGDKTAETRFKEINEAHTVLTDSEKRHKYDTLGPDWEKRFQQYRPGGGTYTATSADFSDFFETLFGQRGHQGTSGGGFDLGSIFARGKNRTPSTQKGSDLEQPVTVTLQEAYNGAERTFTVQSTQPCPTCKGSGLQNDQLCPTCHGLTTVPKTKHLHVKIPAGVKEGSRIRVTGEGNPGQGKAKAGDLYLVVHMTPDSRFRREGDDLYVDVSIPVTKLALGGEVSVPTMGGSVTMKIPAGSQNGRTLRLSGQGMPRLRSDQRGDLYVKANAVLPTSLSEEQRRLFEQLSRAGA